MADFTYGGERYSVDGSVNPPVLVKVTPSGNVPVAKPAAALALEMEKALATERGSKPPSAVSAGSELGATGADADPGAERPASVVGATVANDPGGVRAATTPGAPNMGPFGQAGEPSVNNQSGGAQAPVIPSTPPSSDSLTNPRGTGNALPAEPAPAGPVKPPPTRGQPGYQATDLRTQRADVQRQLDEANKRVNDAGVVTPADATIIQGLNTRITALSGDIDKAETVTPPTTLSGNVTNHQKYIVQQNPGEPPTALLNPAWDGNETDADRKFLTMQVGNNQLVFDPYTGDVKVAYTDADAKGLAAAQQRVADSNAETARKKADAEIEADKARLELERRVSNGEDAASVRAELQRQLEDKFRSWQMSDGDRKASQDALDAYNVERHATAKDTLDINDYNEKVRAAKATEAYNKAKLASDEKTSATTTAAGMRNADVSAAGTKYAADAASVTSRMNAANSLLQAGMTQLADINKYLPPGSDLAGKALEGLMAYGQKFLSSAAGPAPTMAAAPSLDSYGLPGLGGPTPAATVPGTAAASGAINPTVALDASNVGAPKVAPPPPNALTTTAPIEQPAPVDQVPGQNYGASTAYTGGVAPWNAQPAPSYQTGANADPSANASAMLNLFNGPDPAAQMFQQNAAAHQQNMQAGLSPDGSPFASSADVQRIFGRAAA